MKVQENFGKVVRIIREAKGWTIENLAAAANLHYTYLSDVERGRRNVSLKTMYGDCHRSRGSSLAFISRG